MLTRNLLIVAALIGLGGCASIDFEYPRTASYVLTETDDTYLGRQIAEADFDYPSDQSGFHPLRDGIDALAARLLLAGRAEKSIDVQYYLIKDDIVGRAFILALLEAADRGVRVRLLLDDMFTSGYDVGMAALNSHPNFEIRVYNPFKRAATGKAGSALTDFRRINRRMHIKTVTIDNNITLIGGRNIAVEYFGAREDSVFGDLDVLGIGPIVQDVSAMFDLYWNHETALPAPAFVKELDDPQAELDDLRHRLRDARDDVLQSRYANAVKDRVYDYMAEDQSIFRWAPYRLVYDSPDKGITGKASDDSLITAPLGEALRAAENEAIIVSAYFVPLKSGIEALSGLQAKGVDITVITNSLAANNQFMVHAGYKPARKPLLKNGIALYEVRPDATVSGTEFIDASAATATLHTKAFIVDRKAVFIGSFNFDPRSANLNTELGVIIYDPELGQSFARDIETNIRGGAYEVFLDANDRVRWRGWDGDRELIYKKEPETSWWDRFEVRFVGLFPIKSQL